MKISNNIKTEDWQAFVRNHPKGTVFQSPGMYDFFRSVKKFDPVVLGVEDENDQLFGLLTGIYVYEKTGLFKLLSSRFVIYGGPLISGTEEQKRDALNLLLGDLVKKTKHKALFIQLRNYFSWEEYLPVFEGHGFRLLDRLNFIVRLPVSGLRSSETRNRLSNMSESRRRQIKKGLASGAEIIEPESIEQVREFYNILHILYRYKVRKPLADWSFFENFYKLSTKQENNETVEQWNSGTIGIIRLIRYQNKIIGGILAPVFEKKCIYEWYVCGLDKEYKDQYPSVLATWAAIEYAVDSNISSFDFMGVGVPETPYGVREFKARFGGELVNYGRLTRINNRFLYNIAEFGFNILALLKKI